MQDKVLVAQGGGPTVVINQSLAGVVLEARKFQHIGRIYGARHGVQGLIEEDLVDLTRETSHNLEMVALSPSSALGSTRDKPDRQYCHEIFRVLQAHGIGYFLYIGGNDSVDTVRIVSEEAQAAGSSLRCVHIPKTIDNDLVGNDHCPGYPSAARFVAQAFMGANLDNRALPGVYISVVMGRHAGHLALRGGISSGASIILIPEHHFKIERVCELLEERKKRGVRYSIVMVAEGAMLDGADLSLLSQEKDAFGHVRLGGIGNYLAEAIEEKSKLESRVVVLSHLQRGGKPVAYDRRLGFYFGVAAVEAILAKSFGQMVALKHGQMVLTSLHEAVKELNLVDINSSYDTENYRAKLSIELSQTIEDGKKP